MTYLIHLPDHTTLDASDPKQAEQIALENNGRVEPIAETSADEDYLNGVWERMYE